MEPTYDKRREEAQPARRSHPTPRRPLQFSLWWLLLVITGLCVCFVLPGGMLFLTALAGWIVVGALSAWVLVLLRPAIFAALRPPERPAADPHGMIHGQPDRAGDAPHAKGKTG
jgi:hypothetical protein